CSSDLQFKVWDQLTNGFVKFLIGDNPSDAEGRAEAVSFAGDKVIGTGIRKVGLRKVPGVVPAGRAANQVALPVRNGCCIRTDATGGITEVRLIEEQHS